MKQIRAISDFTKYRSAISRRTLIRRWAYRIENEGELVLDHAGKFENQHDEDTDEQEPGHPCEFLEFFIFVFERAKDGVWQIRILPLQSALHYYPDKAEPAI